VSDRSYLAIGEVLALLREEFPDVTISKIRFLESQGLIDPERTPSGYRKFYAPDIDRLRFILREQREHFLPLKVIKDRLESGEVPAGEAEPAVEPAPLPEERLPIWMTRNHPAAQAAPAVATVDGPRALPSSVRPAPSSPAPVSELAGASLTFDELATASGLSSDDLREGERVGLVAGRQVGRSTYYDEDALLAARVAAGFLQFGVEPRHLRMYRNAAEREAGLFEQVILPLVKQRNPQARTEALVRLQELRRLGAELREVMLRHALRDYTDG
jgi:DNA-binding transcriptional MerR regulator